ncbi:bacteriophage Mu Gam like protein [Ostertagia ostertagi]
MNNEITTVKEKYESKINALQEEKEQAFEVMQAYAENNPTEFEGKKSKDFTHGTIGFRTGTPKLSLRKGYKWAGVLDLVKQHMKKYIRTKEELDKDGLLMARKDVDLKTVGLEVVQDESFYVSPKLEVVSA